MMIYLLLGFSIASVYIALCWVAVKKISQKVCLWLCCVIFVVLMIVPFTDIIIGRWLLIHYRNTQQPLEVINSVAKNPESVYWEDNVWPGYDGVDREVLVKRFFKRESIKLLAVKSADGRIYLYSRGKEAHPEVYGYPGELPPIRYKVEFKKVSLPWPADSIIYSDIIRIVDNETGKELAFSKRYISYKPLCLKVSMILSPGANSPFYGGMGVSGKNMGYRLDDIVLLGRPSRDGLDTIRNMQLRGRSGRMVRDLLNMDNIL